MTEREIFVAALRQPGAAGRRAFLDTACGADLELRGRVEALLVEHDRLGSSFLERPAVAIATAARPGPPPRSTVTEVRSSIAAGGMLGPYKLLEVIGEGSMGTVWAADQVGPIRRRVAVKVVRSGMDSRHVLARFEAERQALALMDHPHIARVLDAGATDDGHPYFVMELVRGVPLTQFCDDRHLSLAERLVVFRLVCQAVQHAHQKGVIHRDLKPSNVLVESNEGLPVPKVIDFGLAKAVGATTLIEGSLFTHFGAVVGTPLYMAPEQAEFGALDVDTRADVYALGVILYELLTGTTPIRRGRLAEAAWDEVCRAIKEEEPQSPSDRLGDSGAAEAAIAALRQTEPGKLGRFVRGDLDWVVMKALAKERDRRYPSAAALAEDVERFLKHEPVSAGPMTAGYRLRRFVRRHRPRVVAAGLVLAALLAGMVGTTIGLIRADAALEVAQAAQRAEADQRRAAVAKEAEAEAVVRFFEEKVFAAARPKDHGGGLGSDVTLRDAIAASLPALSAGFADQPLVEARLRTTLGNTFYYLGDSRMAEQHERALAIYARWLGTDHPETLASMGHLATSYKLLGRATDALSLTETALATRRRKLPADHPDTLSSMSNLASLFSDLGRHDDSLRLSEEVLAARRRTLPAGHPDLLSAMSAVASGQDQLGRVADSLRSREDILAALRRTLPAGHPNLAYEAAELAKGYAARGKHADALRLRLEVLDAQRRALPQDHPYTLWSLHNVADSYRNLGRHADALPLDREVLAARERTLGPNHQDTLWSLVSLAQDLVALRLGDESVSIADDCLKRAAGRAIDPVIVRTMVDLRLRHFSTRGDAAGCRASATYWEGQGHTDPINLFYASRIRARTSDVQAKMAGPDADRLAKADADRAAACLKKAVSAGFTDRKRIERVSDFDSLRGRADFQELLAGLPTTPGP